MRAASKGAVLSNDNGRVRQMWHLLEPLHAVLYFAPQVFEEAESLGYRTDERWPSYFALAGRRRSWWENSTEMPIDSSMVIAWRRKSMPMFCGVWSK
ncbi:hypothetical protein STENM223S_07450 [Streptomyces tendae]